MTKNILFKTFYLLFTLLIVFSTQSVRAQDNSLQNRIAEIAGTSKGTVGVAVLGLNDKISININGGRHFPMQSVFKFPLALAILKQVDKGKLALEQKIHVTRAELHPGTWSPLRDDRPAGDFDITLSDLLKYAVSKSDNNVCDILFRLAGGTKAVETYIHDLGIKDISIKATEEEMAKGWDVQYTNWSTPPAMLNLLKLFYRGKVLSKSSTDFLMKIMIETSTGPNRLKGLLPKEAVVAHKTGTSNTNEKGVTAATNDVGIVNVTRSDSFIIVVFVSDSTDDENAREAVIARIAQAVWKHYSDGNSGQWTVVGGQWHEAGLSVNSGTIAG